MQRENNRVRTHAAFTLVELLVVIGIIGILAGILMGSFSGGTESARNARCLSNMRNLAAACQTYAVSSSVYPCAGSVEKMNQSVVRNRSGRKATRTYSEIKGWVSWASKGAYRSSPSTSVKSDSWNISTYEENEETRLYCLTNGAIWKCVGANREVYRCPLHTSMNPNWSYVMNAYFHWSGEETKTDDFAGVWYGHLDRADRVLLFGEMPFKGIGVEAKTTKSPGPDCDCVLQYKGCPGGASSPETIGFNHSSGKQHFAHVAFADGHVEKLVYPKSGLDESHLVELTQWLCQGKDVSFDGKEYKDMSSISDN